MERAEASFMGNISDGFNTLLGRGGLTYQEDKSKEFLLNVELLRILKLLF